MLSEGLYESESEFEGDCLSLRYCLGHSLTVQCITHVADPSVPLQGSIYHRLAAADNVSLEPASTSSDNNQAFSLHALSGDYRRIVVKPKGLTWRLLEYSNPDEPLALSELEKLSGDKEPAALQGVCHCCKHMAWPLASMNCTCSSQGRLCVA